MSYFVRMKLFLAVTLASAAACSSASTPPAPPTRTDMINRGGQPLTLVGRTAEVGQPAPDATLRDAKLAEVKLSGFRGKTVVLSVVPSIDTRVCEAQTHKVSDSIPLMPPGVVVMTVSRDLPFAQERFAEEAMTKTLMGSDYKEREFGRAWGLDVAENGLLARSVWVIAADGTIAYREIVADQTHEPDYAALLVAVRAAAGG
jgi:thioredoxin-dependent peroxiredoxin